jgi:hypothetical protein
MVEPQWNPAVEAQAVAWVLRMGQTREVTVFRYVTANTIEEVGPHEPHPKPWADTDQGFDRALWTVNARSASSPDSPSIPPIRLQRSDLRYVAAHLGMEVLTEADGACVRRS